MLAAAGFGYWMYRLQLKRRLDQAETERLKGLDQFKSRFFTNITHEFRTPLTVILGATDQLDNGAGQWVMPTQKDVVQNKLSLIKRNSENLLRLINQILDLAKLENNTLKINYIQGDVLAFFRYVSESLHSLASANNLTLRVESDQARIVMDYDPERLLQIVHNLLLNAIKFTPSGGRVAIHAEKDGEWLLFRVVDTGVGIPENDLPHLFDRFFQARNQEHAKAGGTGIGLSLTRELVRAMGGSIEVESPVKESGIGTAFSVRLPVTNKAETGVFLPGEQLKSGLPAKPAAQSLRPVDLQTRPLLLLVEDNPDVMEYLSSCLQSIYRIEYAYNGRAGIDKAIETVPDLIVSDVMMPEKDGFEVCEALKNDERTSHIPIVLLTAKSTVEDRIAGLKHGADAYLAKPFREEELLVWVEQLIARRRLLLQRYANLTQPPVASDAREFTLEDNFIIRMRDALERHYNDADFSVDTICREMAMSRAQVHRKLSALTGRSTTEFINTFRLEKARQFLLSSNLNISEIAFQSGFNDPKYFSRLFSETYGLSPSDFRKRQG
jgi:DNA-binding response OmpR family regulator/nitrogen-specific signal transduction histidine kinase